MAEFSTAAELDVVITEQSLREARGTIEAELGEFDVAGAVGGGAGAGGASVADVDTRLEESNRLAQTRNDLLRELLEGAGVAGGGGGRGGASSGSGIGGALGIPGAGLISGAAGALGLGGVTAGGAATALGLGGAAAALPFAAFGGDIRQDTNVPTNAEGEADLFANTPKLRPSNQIEQLLNGVDINKPGWLGSDGTINVQQELVRTTTQSGAGPTAGGSQAGGSPGGSTPPLTVVGGPGSVDTSGSSPGGSTPPLSDVGGPAATGNEAADRRRDQQTPPRRVDVSAEVTVDSLADLGREFEDFVEQKLSEIEDGFR